MFANSNGEITQGRSSYSHTILSLYPPPQTSGLTSNRFMEKSRAAIPSSLKGGVTHAAWALRRDSICRCRCCWRLVRVEGNANPPAEEEEEVAAAGVAPPPLPALE